MFIGCPAQPPVTWPQVAQTLVAGCAPVLRRFEPRLLDPHPFFGSPLVEESWACGSYDIRNLTEVAEGTAQMCSDDCRYAGDNYTCVLCGVRMLGKLGCPFYEGGCFLDISYMFSRRMETTEHLAQKGLSSGNCLTTRDSHFSRP